MSKSGGIGSKVGSVTGRVVAGQTKKREIYIKNVVFEPQWWGSDLVFGAVSAATNVVTGAVSQATKIASGAVSQASRITTGASSVAAAAVRQAQTAVSKISMPKIEIPRIEIPKIEIPKIEIPKIPVIEIPKIAVPSPVGVVSDIGKAVTGAGISTSVKIGAVAAGALGAAGLTTHGISGAISGAISSVVQKPTYPVTGAPLDSKIESRPDYKFDASTGTYRKVEAVSEIKPVQEVKTASEIVSSQNKDIFTGLKCGIFGCDDQKGILSQIGETASGSAKLLENIRVVSNAAVAKTGSDFLKTLPDLGNVQKATQSLVTSVATLGAINPITAPIAITAGLGGYIKNILSPQTENITSPTVEPEIKDTGILQRQAALPVPGEIPAGGLPEGVYDPYRNQYGEDHSLAECTIKTGDYVGFVKRYKYTESYPNACLAADEVKFYTPLGNYKQQEIVGVPEVEADGRITIKDRLTGMVIEDVNQELITSGAFSVGKPKTSLVYQVWATTPATPVGGATDYDHKQANRFNIEEFRDEYSDELESEVDKMNKTKGADYTSVNFSRLGAELYGGKVLPIDGRVLNPSLFTQETDYGKKIGLDFPANNAQKVYGDIGQAKIGTDMAQKVVAAANAKGSLSAISEKATTDISTSMGKITNGFVLKPETKCNDWDILCGIGKTLDTVNPNSICAKDSTNPMCQGFRAVENTALQIVEGIPGAIPSIADIAYDTTTGAIEKVRGLEEGSLKRLGARQSWDNLFEKTTADTLGISIDKQYYTKALGLDKQTADEGVGTIVARAGVELFEDVLSHPVEYFTPGIIEAEMIMSAPAIGEGLAEAITGNAKEEVKYSYMIENGDIVQYEDVSTIPVGKPVTVGEKAGSEGNTVIDVIIYTDDPTLAGKTVISESPIPPVQKASVLEVSGVVI